jgi:hypothetical protein
MNWTLQMKKQMTNKYMKKMFNILIHHEMQIKTTLRFYFTLFRMIKKTNKC